MQVIHVLCNHPHVKVLFQLHQSRVGSIGIGCNQFFAQHVVELVDKGRVTQEALMARYIHHGIILPQSIGIAEGFDAALGTDAGS